VPVRSGSLFVTFCFWVSFSMFEFDLEPHRELIGVDLVPTMARFSPILLASTVEKCVVSFMATLTDPAF